MSCAAAAVSLVVGPEHVSVSFNGNAICEARVGDRLGKEEEDSRDIALVQKCDRRHSDSGPDISFCEQTIRLQLEQLLPLK